jgi:hypothetical protein
MQAPEHFFGQQPFPAENPQVRRYLIVAALLLGVYRATVFHPYFRSDYLRWLKLTPWTVARPLPLGPLELVLEDCIAIGLILLLSTSLPEPRSVELLNICLFGHLVVLTATFWRTKAAGFGYCAAILLGFVPLLWTRPWLDLIILTVIYIFVHEGVWRSLRQFPWETGGFVDDLGLAQKNEATPPCAWYFDRFHRDISIASGVNRVDAVLACMLGGWWLYVLTSLIPDPRARITAAGFSNVTVMVCAPLVRLVIYHQGCRPPISFWGRICTLRWIIPGYDQVFIGPIGALLAVPATVFLLRSLSVPIEIRFAIAAPVAALIALIAPPRLKRWRLVGHRRLVPTMNESQAATLYNTR